MTDGSVRFDGRVAIVTGSGRGLGREYAVSLGRLGAAVVVNSTKEKTAQSTAEEIIRAGGTAVAVVGSVADRLTADSLVEAAVKNFGRVDIVINDAGSGDSANFENEMTSKLSDSFSVHVVGAWNVTQAAWPYMKAVPLSVLKR